MAIYFVDISVSNDPNTANDGLTELLPLTWDNFIASLLINNSPDFYNLRGEREVLSSVSITALHQDARIQGWNLNVYGPWRLLAESLFFHCSAKDGIINAITAGDISTPAITIGGFDNTSIELNNMHFQATLGWIYLEENKSQLFKGCNISSFGDLKLSYSVLYDIEKYFENCIIQCASLSINNTSSYMADFIIDNCIFTISEIDFDIATTVPNLTTTIEKAYCQFSLIPIIWPAWDSYEKQWRYENLGTNITVSGSGIYTGYEYGLFGYPRNNLGAFSFNFIHQEQYNDFIFAFKSISAIGSHLTVVNNMVSFMRLQENADTVIGNIHTNEPILVRGQGTIEEADYNLNNEEGQRGIGITPSIADTGVYDPLLPSLLEEDFYKHKRSQLVENGDDSADAGAIEVNYLDDSRSYQDIADDNLASLSHQARNIMARSTIGQAGCKITGFAIGRSGYEYHNPVKVLPLNMLSDNARGWIVVLSNTWVATDTIEFQGHLAHKTIFKPIITGSELDGIPENTYYFAVGASIEDTIDNIIEKINTNLDLMDTVYTERENDTLHIISVPCGTIGNTIWYSAVGLPFSTPHAVPLTGGSLTGGVDEIVNNVIIDPIYEGTVDAEQCIVEYANQSAIACTVKIHPNLGIRSAVGEFVLKAEITQSVFPDEVGTEFAFAVGHHPIASIHSKSLWVKRFVIQL